MPQTIYFVMHSRTFEQGPCLSTRARIFLNYLQSAFSLKIRLVLISATTLTLLGFACSNFAKKNNRLLAVKDIFENGDSSILHFSLLFMHKRRFRVEKTKVFKIRSPKWRFLPETSVSSALV